MENKFSGAREWKDEFSFLAKTELDHLYLMILGMAKSKRDIERLHSLLDGNCRLLRRDLIKLENFWEKYFSSQKNRLAESKLSTLDDELVRWLFSSQCGGKNNFRYYFDYLSTKVLALGWPWPTMNKASMIVSYPENIGHGYTNFFGSIFDAAVDLECYLSRDRKNIFVNLLIDESNLTEDVAYRFGQIPLELMHTQVFQPREGRGIRLFYYLPAADLLEPLSEFSEINCHGETYFLARDSFLSKFEVALKESGAPIQVLFNFKQEN